MPSLAVLKWFAIGGLVIALLIAMNIAGSRKAALDKVTGERDTAVATSKAWEEAHGKQVELAGKTAEARAKERQDIVVIRDAAGTAKEGISNAPGASDPFRYSDSAYRFMRNDRSKASAHAAAPDAGVDGR